MIEQGEARREARVVVALRRAQADDRRGHAGRFLPIELGLLQIDVVHDLRDGGYARLANAEALDEHLERTVLALVREFRVEHVETDLARFRLVALRGNELEAGRRVHEPSNEP